MNRVTVYGFGSRGRDVVDQILTQGREVSMIFDRAPGQPTYRGVPVCNLDTPEARACAAGSHCVIGLHNSYVDIHEVYLSLKEARARPLSLINATQADLKLAIGQGFWLDPTSPSFHISDEDAGWILETLADERSCEVFNALKRYRETGDIADCPFPSITDEYTPTDLPRYLEPLRLLDCGAYTGVAYRKFAKHYAIQKYMAFEPDPKNFTGLSSHTFPCDEVTLLPLGVWSKTEVLRFSVGKDMGSNIDSAGESLIQCVAVDDVVQTFDTNLIKFDIEGAEMNGLLGMRRLIQKHRPSLCISVYHRPEDLVELPKLIASWDLDYKLHLRNHEHNGFGTVLYAHPQ